ncbi:hypothetical protein [Caballeronia sordidicola]|uniref:hypothetical protein n=1 Tax=Caballeronia sordidicola TaxID=196367 RepID=UPI000B796493|nr:hypothetical protein [Caballeronia sordidicola]
MDDNLQSKIAQAANIGLDMNIIGSTNQAAVNWSRTRRKSANATKTDPDGDIATYRTPAKKHPYDWCDKLAGLLVNPTNRQLRHEYLSCSIDKLRETLGTLHGKDYAVTDAFVKKPRSTKISKDGNYPHTISKLVTALASRGVAIPTIEQRMMSFNQIRRHLLGKGKAQEFTLANLPYITLGRRFVAIGGKQFNWVNVMGLACEVDTAVGLEHNSRMGKSFLVYSDFEGLVGLARNEIERRCSLAPQ